MIYAEVVDDELSSLGFLGQGICTLLLLDSLLAGWRSVDLAILVKRGCRSIHWARWGLLGFVVIVDWWGGKAPSRAWSRVWWSRTWFLTLHVNGLLVSRQSADS